MINPTARATMIRCLHCNKLLAVLSECQGVHIEVKCPRCRCFVTYRVSVTESGLMVRAESPSVENVKPTAGVPVVFVATVDPEAR